MNPRDYLAAHGVPDEEIEAAASQGWLHLLALDRWILPGERRYTRDEAAELGGVSVEIAMRLWRALGFPDVPPSIKAFTDADVEVLVLARERTDEFERLEYHLQQTRVISSSMARIAELWTDEMARLFEAASERGRTPDDVVAGLMDEMDLSVLPLVFDFIHRRQLLNSMWRRFASHDDEGDEPTMVIGFIDLVGYTAMSQTMSGNELGELVGRFEALTHDRITEVGGRIIKRIGDAVMFSADDPVDAALAAVAVLDELHELDLSARVGLAYGGVVMREGDAFGRVVNLASRLVSMARPDAVLIDEAVHDVVGVDERFKLRFLGRRRVKDMGPLRLWVLRRSDQG